MLKIEHSLYKTSYHFDADKILNELEGQDWTDHNLFTAQGNSALILVSTKGEVNHEFNPPMLPTDALNKMPYTSSIWDTLGIPKLRSRFMKIKAGGFMPEHYDTHPWWRDKVRIHIPVKTNEKVVFRCGEAIANMKAGECWVIDNADLHEVINPSDEDRIHLVLDCPITEWPRLRDGNI